MSDIGLAGGPQGPGFPCTLIEPDETELENQLEQLSLDIAAQVKQCEAKPDDQDQVKALDDLKEQVEVKSKKLAALSQRPRKRYIFLPLSQYDKGELSEWLSEKARNEALKTRRLLYREANKLRDQLQRGVVNELVMDELRAEIYRLEQEATTYLPTLDKAITAGEFQFGQQISIRTMQTLDGTAMVAWVMLRGKQPAMRLEQVRSLVLVYGDQMLDVMANANSLGNSKSQPTMETANQ
jgi:hypothetical protein